MFRVTLKINKNNILHTTYIIFLKISLEMRNVSK